jgi:hypothetical protein
MGHENEQLAIDENVVKKFKSSCGTDTCNDESSSPSHINGSKDDDISNTQNYDRVMGREDSDSNQIAQESAESSQTFFSPTMPTQKETAIPEGATKKEVPILPLLPSASSLPSIFKPPLLQPTLIAPFLAFQESHAPMSLPFFVTTYHTKEKDNHHHHHHHHHHGLHDTFTDCSNWKSNVTATTMMDCDGRSPPLHIISFDNDFMMKK